MTVETHSQLANFIWSICNLLRGPYKRNEYRKVILPLTVLRRFDCILAPTKAQVLEKFKEIKGKPETVVRSVLQKTTRRPFYNLSKLDLPRLLNDPNQLAPNLNSYINAFTPNVRAIMERFAFDQQIARMAEKNLLYQIIKAFCDPKLDLSVERPLRLNFQASAERIARLDDESGFKNLASSAKKDPAVRQQEIELGQQRQEEIRTFLRTLGSKLYKDREAFLSHLRKSASSAVKPLCLSSAELKAVLPAPGDRDGKAESDPELRDTENVPLKESIEAYFKREVLPHVLNAWIDSTKTKVGYEIPLNRYFYRYEPPRPREAIEQDIKGLEDDIVKMLKEVTA